MIPAMMKLAPALGMVDEPSSRKVHAIPIPRVGGVGIVLGGMVPAFIWIPFDPTLAAYLIGSLVLLVFGLWDDRQEMGHYSKFLGQFLAVVPIVTYGGLYVDSLPFLGLNDIPPLAGQAFTAIALIGMINATNHSDGLDGLAGGVSLLSLGAISVIAYLANDFLALAICAATAGGILGFLRFNTHPATVFMGDGGSQYLGFTVGFLSVHLVERSDSTLSPAFVLLLLGLPIADILMVLAKRIREGSNWFEATKNHIHHELLQLGFVHQESVVIIYSIQTISVLAALAMQRANDWVILAVYSTLYIALFMALSIAAQAGWRAHAGVKDDAFGNAVTFLRYRLLVVPPRRFLEIGIPAYLVLTSLWISTVPRDFGIAAALVVALMVYEFFWGKTLRSVVRRGLIYVTAAFVAYLNANQPPAFAEILAPVETLFFVLMAVSVGVAIRFSPARRRHEFRPTAMDYLMVFILLAGLFLSENQLGGDRGTVFVVQLVVLFYGCELLIIERREHWNALTVGSLATATLLALRGLLG